MSTSSTSLSDSQDQESETADTAAPQEGAQGHEAAEPVGSQDELVLQKQPMISVSRLKPDPDNPRKDPDLNPSFLASLEHLDVEVPLLIRPDPDDPGMCVVVEGHRRYFGALEVGLEEVPYKLQAPQREADRFISMYLTNAAEQRRNHSPWEQTQALFMAHQAGATKTELHKSLGLKRETVRQAVKAGRLTDEQVAAAHEITHGWTVEEYGLLGEFGEDPEALHRLRHMKAFNGSLEHEAALIRQEHADAAEHERIKEQLTAQGILVTEDLPLVGLPLNVLRTGDQEGDEDLDTALHADCPGRGVYFPGSITEPVPYCSDPKKYGHGVRDQGIAERLNQRVRALEAGAEVLQEYPAESTELSWLEHEGRDMTSDDHLHCPGAQIHPQEYGLLRSRYYCSDPERYGHAKPAVGRSASPKSQVAVTPRALVVRGNREWQVASTVRRKFLEQVGRRRSLPKGGDTFLARALLERPTPIVNEFGASGSEALFTRFTGKSFKQAGQEVGKAKAGRLQLLLLVQVLAAFEHEIAGDTDRRYTWRSDRANWRCRRDEAGDYLKFLMEIGYQVAPIEKAVASGVPYTGADPDQGEVEQNQAAQTQAGEPSTNELAEESTAASSPDPLSDDGETDGQASAPDGVEGGHAKAA